MASASTSAFSAVHLSCSVRLIIQTAPTRFAEPQWMNTGWLLRSATAARKPSTMAGSGEAP